MKTPNSKSKNCPMLPLGLGIVVFIISAIGLSGRAHGSNAGQDSAFTHADWTSMGLSRGPAGDVFTALGDPSGRLYVGGWFCRIGGIHANNVAMWDGNTWSRLGEGVSGWGVRTMARSGETLYVGGSLTRAGGLPIEGVARWDGEKWSRLGDGLHREGGSVRVSALLVKGDHLYVAGEFDRAGSKSLGNIACWNGSEWSSLGKGINGEATALTVFGGELHVAGKFSRAGEQSVRNIAKWDGDSWYSLGEGLSTGGIRSMASFGGELYVAGDRNPLFTRWDGEEWVTLDRSKAIRALTVRAGTLYAAASDHGVLRWNETLLELEPTGYEKFATSWNGAMAVAGDHLVAIAAGGAGLGPDGRMLKCNGQNWEPFEYEWPLGLDGGVHALHALNDHSG